MQIHHKPTKILIVGKSGSGKTTYELRFVKNAEYAHVFIFDHKLEFHERLEIPASLSIDGCLERLKKGEKYISYHHSEEWPGDAEGGFQFYCEWVFEISKALREDGQQRLFACDEVNRFTGTSDMGASFRQLIEDGRLQGLDFIGTSHAANQIHNRLRLQLSEIVALRTLDPRPLAFLEENGFDPAAVKSLPTGAFIVKDLDSDIFTTGKLFSCPLPKKEVDPEKDEEHIEKVSSDNPTETHALSRPPTDPPAVHRLGQPRPAD